MRLNYMEDGTIAVQNDQGRHVATWILNDANPDETSAYYCCLTDGSTLMSTEQGYRWISDEYAEALIDQDEQAWQEHFDLVEAYGVDVATMSSSLIDMQHEDGGFIPDGVDPEYRDAEGQWRTPDEIYTTVGLVSGAFNKGIEHMTAFMPEPMREHFIEQWKLYFGGGAA